MTARQFFATTNAELLLIASENKTDRDLLEKIKVECELRATKNPKSQAAAVFDYVVAVMGGATTAPMPTVIAPKVRVSAAAVPVTPTATPESVAAAIRAAGLDANDVIVALARAV